MDADLRALERAAKSGDARDVEAYAAALARKGDYSLRHKLLTEATRVHMLGVKETIQKIQARHGSLWRPYAEAVVRFVRRETRGWPAKEQGLALRNAYPFGQRSNWPYKVWLKVVREFTKPDVAINRVRAAKVDTQTRSMFPEVSR